MLVANFLIFFAEVAFVLMASVWAKNNLTALSVALISVVAPLIVYMVVPGSFGEWLSTLLPAGGIGLSNALMYKMISFDFLYAGGHAFFQADVLLASAPIKIVLLVGLAAWGYLRKTKGGLKGNDYRKKRIGCIENCIGWCICKNIYKFQFVAPLRTASAALYFYNAKIYSLFSDGLVDISL